MRDSIRDLLENGLREEVYPGAVLIVAQGKQIVSLLNIGNRALVPKHLPMEKETIFDLASLTKPLGTALACLKLVDQGLLDLDTAISDFIEPFPWKDKVGLSTRLLLNHSAGLAHWKPFYRELMRYPVEERKPLVRRLIMEEPLLEAPKSVSLYSDLGFMLLEWIVEVIAEQDLSSFLDAAFYQPLGLETLYLDHVTIARYKKERFAATEYCAWRRQIVQGHVHDENAHALGGYSGHAGLFGTAQDVLTVASTLVGIHGGAASELLSPETVRTLFSRQSIVEGSTFALGWDTPGGENPSCGVLFSSNSVGHTGFTGTSLWIDLDKNITVIFLTNRVHPTRSNEKIREFRPKLHNLIMREFGYG